MIPPKKIIQITKILAFCFTIQIIIYNYYGYNNYKILILSNNLILNKNIFEILFSYTVQMLIYCFYGTVLSLYHFTIPYYKTQFLIAIFTYFYY